MGTTAGAAVGVGERGRLQGVVTGMSDRGRRHLVEHLRLRLVVYLHLHESLRMSPVVHPRDRSRAFVCGCIEQLFYDVSVSVAVAVAVTVNREHDRRRCRGYK